MNMKTKDRVGQTFDYGKIMKIDDKDYISNWKIDPKEIVIKGNVKYTNPEDAYPVILTNIEDNVRAKINTIDGAKALAQHAVKTGFNLAVPEEKEKAIKSLSQTLFDINKVNFDKAVVETKPDKVSADERNASLGYKADKEPVYKSRAELLYNLYKGNPAAIQSLKNSIPDAKIQNELGFFRITLPAYTNSQGVTFPEKKLDIDKRSPRGFLLEANKIYEILGERKGYKDIPYEELSAFLSSPKNSRYNKRYDPSTFYKGKATTSSQPKKSGGLADQEF